MPVNQCDGVRLGQPCRSLFALALHACPHCGSVAFHVHGTQPGDEEYHWMPKIARATGTTDANVDPVPVVAVAEPADVAAPPSRPESVASVLAGVDGDPDRARQALETEQSRDVPRKTLVAELEKILAEDAATTPDTDTEPSEPVTADAG